MNEHTQKGGFTIVETLVAITILMIAIAGPLSIASKGLSAAATSRDQMIASFLAQESAESIKNARDNNVAASAQWLSATILACDNASATRHCDAAAIDPTPVLSSSLTTYPLKLTTGNYYSHECSGTCRTTPFSRYFYITEPGSVNPCTASDIECTLVVNVSWNEGGVPYSVVSTMELMNSPR